MDAEDFTTNEVIDNIQIGDNTVDIIGYGTKFTHNFHSSPSKSKFYKFVVNNAQGKEVQVTAWNENTSKISKIKEMGKIVYISSAKAAAIKESKFNNGNVPFELLIKDNTQIEVFGTYEKDDSVPVEEVSILESFGKINKKIMIEAYIKSEPCKYKSRDFEFIIGSITDGFYKLEIKFNGDCVIPKDAKKGCCVQVTGVMEQFPPGPPALKVELIVPISNKNRMTFIDIIGGYRNKE